MDRANDAFETRYDLCGALFIRPDDAIELHCDRDPGGARLLDCELAARDLLGRQFDMLALAMSRFFPVLMAFLFARGGGGCGRRLQEDIPARHGRDRNNNEKQGQFAFEHHEVTYWTGSWDDIATRRSTSARAIWRRVSALTSSARTSKSVRCTSSTSR